MSKAKRKKPYRKMTVLSAESDLAATDTQVVASNLSLHELFQQQTTAMLESSDLSDEQKQSILIAMSCPCCCGGGMSFTAKLKRGK